MAVYSNRIVDTSKSVTEADLQELEQVFNIKLPLSIKSHYLIYNGGFPEKSLFIDKDGDEYSVDYFIEVKHNSGNDLFETLRLLHDPEVMPLWLIPFGYEAGGNLFCMSTRVEDNGVIYYYNHEFEYGDDPENHVTYLSPSLLEFINSLKYDKQRDDAV